MTWRLHREDRPRVWQYCDDPNCSEPHRDYTPFHPMNSPGRVRNP